jgi:hypothetical protein
MKRIKLYNKDGDVVICWADTAAKLIANGWTVDEPTKGQAKTEKSVKTKVATLIEDKED